MEDEDHGPFINFVRQNLRQHKRKVRLIVRVCGEHRRALYADLNGAVRAFPDVVFTEGFAGALAGLFWMDRNDEQRFAAAARIYDALQHGQVVEILFPPRFTLLEEQAVVEVCDNGCKP